MKKVLAMALSLALAASLLAACGGTTPAVTTYVDGTYRAEAYAFSRGYKEFLEVTYENDVITNVVFDAFNEVDPTLMKSQLTIEEYPMFDAEGNDFQPSVWYPTLMESIKNAATPEDVEIIAGATHTAESAREFFAAIQEAAKVGNTETIIIGGPTYIDGTYRAEAADFSRGYKEFMEVTYAGGVITGVVFDAFNEEDPTLMKSHLTIEEYPMFDAEGNDFQPSVWYPTLMESVKNAKTPEDIELIAGATHTAESAREFFALIQEAAIAGNTATIVAPAADDGTTSTSGDVSGTSSTDPDAAVSGS